VAVANIHAGSTCVASSAL